SQLVLTIDAKDINFSQNGSYGWQFTGTTTGNVRSRINFFNGNVTMKITGTGTEATSTVLYSQADYSSITDLQLTFTWDLANNTMSLAANGSGVLAAGGTGTITLTTESFAQDLSGVTNLTGFRTYVQGQGTSYMQLDRVSILANGATLSTSNTVLDSAKVWYSKGDNALHIRGVEADSVKSVKVYSITGALASEYVNPGNDIALGDLSSGLYIASVLSEHGTKAFKFVK
uniref:T9SS type A sorting domain-containing protein n=2 Tax=Polaribacter sp. TaxID=1920175 RepID=UPI00404859EE